MIGKRKGLMWGCKGEDRAVFMVFRGCMNNSTCEQYHKKEKKKKKRERREIEETSRRG